MNLPKTENPLLDFADQCEVSKSLIYNFIEQGGAEFVHRVFIEYMAKELIDKDFFDKYTPVGAVAHSRDVLGTIFNNFKEQFDNENGV
jgi:hypothetical protein